MAADLGQTNENIKRFAVSASKNTNALQLVKKIFLKVKKTKKTLLILLLLLQYCLFLHSTIYLPVI
jgi:predicted transcriptional regulator